MKYLILAGIIGLLSGIANFIFGTVLNLIMQVNMDLVPINLVFLPLVGVFIVFLYQKYGKQSNLGFKVCFHAMEGLEEVPNHHGPLMIFTTWLGHLFGASVGREGVAVQMGATIADNLARLPRFNISQMDRKRLIGAGMASGFAALFGTPIAGIFFAKEMTKIKFNDFKFIFITVIAAFVGNFVTTTLGLNHFHVHIESGQLDFSILIVIKLIIIGGLLSLLGHTFASLLAFLKQFFAQKLPNPYIRIFTMSIILSLGLYLIGDGRYISLGTNLINDSFYNPQSILYFDCLFKLLFTTFTISIGFQGGEVTPLFSIGATFGVVIATLFNLPVLPIAACSYAMMFGAATSAYFSAFFIALEVFGLNILFPLIIISLSAYVLRFKTSIYPI